MPNREMMDEARGTMKERRISEPVRLGQILPLVLKNIEKKLESLSAKSISYEYRLRAIEKHIPAADIAEECF